MKKLVGEFREFINRGNVLDMAVGVVIATAFGKITSALVNEVFMPLLSWIFGSRNMTALNITVREAAVNEAGEVTQEAITLGFGSFLGAVVDFLLIALVVFAIVKAANRTRALWEKEKAEEPAPTEEKKPTTEELLSEILNELREKK